MRLTGVSSGNSGSAREVTRTRGHGLALEIAVKGIGSMSLEGVGEEAQPIRLYRAAVSTSGTCIVQSSLQCLVSYIASCHAPVSLRRWYNGSISQDDDDDDKQD